MMLLYYPAHERDGVHVYARFSSRGEVHARTDSSVWREARREDGVDKTQVAFRKNPLVRKRREAADEIHARLVRGAVRGVRAAGEVISSGTQRQRAISGLPRDALVDNGLCQLPLDGAAGFDKLPRAALYLVVYLSAALVHARLRSQAGYAMVIVAHRGAAGLSHVYGLQNFTAVEERWLMGHLRSCAWLQRCPAAGYGYRARALAPFP